MTDKLLTKLIYAGYREMQASSERPGYGVYYDMMQKLVNAVIFVEADKYNSAFVEDFRSVFAMSMQAKGYSTHTFVILLVNSESDNYTEQIGVARQVCDTDRNAWIYDEALERLIVYEEQAEEFYGLRNIIENLEPPADFKPFEEVLVVSRKDKAKATWKGLPKVSMFLVLVNVIVYIVCTFTGSLLYNKGGVGYELVSTPDQWYRVISSMFLHLNVTHISSNMLLLFCLGELVEPRIGAMKFAVAYFLCGLCGTLCTFVSEVITGEYVVVFGASGAVYGILGIMFALVFFRKLNKVHMSVSRILAVITLAIADGFISSENIANWSHIGGLISGILIGSIFCLLDREKVGVTNED